MVIETKYNIGQEVWVRYGYNPLKVVVRGRNDKTGYYLIDAVINNEKFLGIKHSKNLFPTKEDLLKTFEK